MEQNNVQLRSEHCFQAAYIKFVNLTNRIIEVIWVNYSGEYQRYTLLRKGQYVDINTFETHPWIAMDVNTKDRMLLNKSYIYMPEPYREREENRMYIKYPIIPPKRRTTVKITLPLYSLRYRTLLQIRDLLKEPEYVDKLSLPTSLITDLKEVFMLKSRMCITIKP